MVATPRLLSATSWRTAGPSIRQCSSHQQLLAMKPSPRGVVANVDPNIQADSLTHKSVHPLLATVDSTTNAIVGPVRLLSGRCERF